jgi:hypothetical protein
VHAGTFLHDTIFNPGREMVSRFVYAAAASLALMTTVGAQQSSAPSASRTASATETRAMEALLRPGTDLYVVYTHNWLDDPLENRIYTLDRRAASKFPYTQRF